MKVLVAMIVLLGLLFLGVRAMFTLPGYAPGECFGEHIHDAIQLNETRKPLYAQLSGGASTEVSRGLIWMERASLLMGRFSPKYRFDARDTPYREAGMSILCADLVSMDDTPPFAGRYSGSPPATNPYGSRPTSALGDDLRTALSEGGLQGLSRAAIRQVERLDNPRTNCLVRHLIESIARVATLAPGQIAAAEARGLPSPAPLIHDLVDFHLMGIGMARRIDRRALEVQRMGIPILCQDVPVIPLPEPPVNPVQRVTHVLWQTPPKS